MSLFFDFYGVCVKVDCSDRELLENIRRDFSYFYTDSQAQLAISISVYLESPDFDKVQFLKASLYNSDSIAYDDKNIRYVDYQGKALSIYDYRKEEGKIYSSNRELLHELVYLLILSRVGELLDKKGIHRIHALGFSIKENGILCLLPQGAGKTTLALELLKRDDVKLLSDDTVLINRRGQFLAFPLRIGVSSDFKLDIPPQYLRTFKRRKYGQKTLIDIEYFRDKIAGPIKPSILLIGERIFSSRAKIVRVNKIKAILPLVRDAVIGLGLAQMVEYYLRFDFKDIFSKICILLSRLLVSFKFFLHGQIHRFLIGRDVKKNAEIICRFLNLQE